MTELSISAITNLLREKTSVPYYNYMSSMVEIAWWQVTHWSVVAELMLLCSTHKLQIIGIGLRLLANFVTYMSIATGTYVRI